MDWRAGMVVVPYSFISAVPWSRGDHARAALRCPDPDVRHPHAPGRVAAAQRRDTQPAQPGTGGRHAHRLPLPRRAVQMSQAVLLGQVLTQGPVHMPRRHDQGRKGALMKAWHAALVGILLALTTAHPTVAEIPAAPSRAQSDLVWLFPNFAQLPAGMVLAEEGSRGAAEIAATFRDPVDAAQVLTTWGWVFNAYQTYVAGPGAGPQTPA